MLSVGDFPTEAYMTPKEFLDAALLWLRTDGIRLALALAVLFVAFHLVNLLSRRILARGIRHGADKTLLRALVRGGRLAAKGAILLLLLGFLGVDTASIATVFASLGVGVGLAVNGALSNAAGGLLLLLTRPFRLDDYIEVAGFEGTVEEIHLVTTRLTTIDNRTVHIPNGKIVSETVTNYSEKAVRRLDLDLALPTDASAEVLREPLLAIVREDGRVLPAPAPRAVVTGRSERALHLSLRLHVKNIDYWDLRFSLWERIAAYLTEAGIGPVPLLTRKDCRDPQRRTNYENEEGH